MIHRVVKKICLWSKLDVLATFYYRLFLRLDHSVRFHIYPHSVIHIDKPCQLKLNRGEFSINVAWYGGARRKYTSELWLMPDSELCVEDSFQLYRGASIYLAPGARMLIKGQSYINTNSQINCFSYIEIGRGTIISDDVMIHDSDNHLIKYEGRNNNLSTKPIIIGDHVWIGKNALILKGVHIGDGAVVAAGSVVVKDVPANTLVAGNPAEVKKYNVEWE